MARLIDLSPVLEEGMVANHPYHPRAPLVLPNQRFAFTKDWQGNIMRRHGAPRTYDGIPEDWVDPDSVRGYQSESVLIHTHLGAHVDAALHYNPESSQDAAAIPLEQCFGSAVLLDLRHLGGEPFKITIADLEEAESRGNLKIEPQDIVILHTGWMARWGAGAQADQYRYGSVPNPGLHSEAPPWFIDRQVKLVGADVGNIDYDPTSSAHINFLCREAAGKAPILIVENLANLERIPTARFLFIGLPLPIRDGTGSPIRAVAVIEDD